MYYLLSLLIGIVLSVMISFNGKLSDAYNIYIAAVIIHVAGIIFVFLLCKIKKKKISLKGKKLPLWIYLGGVIGVLTTIFNNFAYGKISMTSIVALGLLGQTITSLLIDCFGLFGMKKHPLNKESLIGLVFSLVGIYVMMDRLSGAAFYAVLLSLATGICVVLSRTVNARLSKHLGEWQSTLINYCTGLPVTVILALILLMKGSYTMPDVSFSFSQIWIYMGGLLGVFTVLLYNIIVPKVPAFHLTLLTFAGEVFTGILLDIFAGQSYSPSTLWGGILVTLGIALNLTLEHVLTQKRLKPREE